MPTLSETAEETSQYNAAIISRGKQNSAAPVSLTYAFRSTAPSYNSFTKTTRRHSHRAITPMPPRSTRGELRSAKENVSGDVDGDGRADFKLAVDGSNFAAAGASSSGATPFNLHSDDLIL